MAYETLHSAIPVFLCVLPHLQHQMAANAIQQESRRAAPTATPVIIPAWGED